MKTKSVLIFLALFIGVLAVKASRASEESKPMLEMWGTCYFYYRCEGNPVGLGKTASECRAQGGHSLMVPQHGCYNL